MWKGNIVQPDMRFFADICSRFDLGNVIGPPIDVPGGLSNRLYRLRTDRGEFAVKRMVASAESPSFQGNVEAAFAVEQRAADAGIAMPSPVPVQETGQALARIAAQNGSCWVRVHRWIAGDPVRADQFGSQGRDELATILARLHRLPCADLLPDTALEATPAVRDWEAAFHHHGKLTPSLSQYIAELERIIRLGYDSGVGADVVSHRDLDPKNLLRTTDGLSVIDWDAAGPTNAHWDTMIMALDWSGVRDDGISTDAFERFLAAYTNAGGMLGQIKTASFSGWAEGVLDWLWFNLERATANDPIEHQLGRSEVTISARFIPPATEWITARR